MDVLTAFREEFPDPLKQREITGQLVHEATGRVFATGQAGQSIEWIKIVGLGAASSTEWFCEVLRGVDREPGEWIVSSNGDPYSAVLVMYRSKLSLDNYVRNLIRRRGNGAPLTVLSGADPLTFILPPVRPDPQQFAVTLVHGITAETVRLGQGLFTIVDPDTGEVQLGENADEARRVLRHSYPTRVRLTVAWAHALARGRVGVLARLNQLRARLAAGDARFKALVNEEAISLVEQQAEQLWPYFRRMPRQETGS